MRNYAITNARTLASTVEPPNNGHVGDECFVHYSEVVPSSEVLTCIQLLAGGTQFVHCREVVRSSECPLLEVPLYKLHILCCCTTQLHMMLCYIRNDDGETATPSVCCCCTDQHLHCQSVQQLPLLCRHHRPVHGAEPSRRPTRTTLLHP